MKKILFVTGTRADYGKMKPLMQALNAMDEYEVYIFVCGMHLIETFGYTYREVLKDNYENVHVAFGISQTNNASINLGSTITNLAGYVENVNPDMLIVHGDRMDALAGATVGALHNILVGHIEGGELSGTIDESIRHAISKFAHIHFTCTEEAKRRLIQLGEESNRIFVIGSPDIDVMMSSNLPSLDDAKERYEIGFENYGILMYHPVTTEYECAGINVEILVDALIESKKNYVVIYPNNDLGSEIILNEYHRFDKKDEFRAFPSLRFEHFLTLLKNAEFIIGNSSAGIRESGIYGIPAIDIGTRQAGRYSAENCKNVQHTKIDKEEILRAINNVPKYRVSSNTFGEGNSTEKFIKSISDTGFWDTSIQKKFVDFHSA